MVGPPMENWSQGQTKSDSKISVEQHQLRKATCRKVKPGHTPGARPGGWSHRQMPSSAWRSNRKPNTCREKIQGWVHCELGGRWRWGPWLVDPWCCKMAVGMWNVTSLDGKEPMLVREMEQYQLKIFGLTSTLRVQRLVDVVDKINNTISRRRI